MSSEHSDEISEALEEVDPVGAAEESAGAVEGEEAESMSFGSSEDGGKSIADRLFSTEPNTPLEHVESPFNPEQGGFARIFRGIQKMGVGDSMPAAADLLIGVLEEQTKSDSPISVMGSDGDGRGGDEQQIQRENAYE